MATALSEQELCYVLLVCRYPKPTMPEIAEQMGLSQKTVEKYRDKAYKKLGVNCHSDLDHRAVQLGLVKCMCVRMKERDTERKPECWHARQNKDNSNKPRIRPNPNTGRFTVEFPDPLMADSYYSVYDAQGKLLYQRPLPAGATLEEVDLGRFGSGTYVIKFTSPDGMCYERVVVE